MAILAVFRVHSTLQNRRKQIYVVRYDAPDIRAGWASTTTTTKLIHSLIGLQYASVCVCYGMCVEVRRQLAQSQFSHIIYHVGVRARTQVIRLGSEQLSWMNYLAGTGPDFYNSFSVLQLTRRLPHAFWSNNSNDL